jgi:hypothetical protein
MQQNLAKLKHFLAYVHGSLDEKYVVGTNDVGKLRMRLKASYAVHFDCKSHMEGVISLCRGALSCKIG